MQEPSLRTSAKTKLPPSNCQTHYLSGTLRVVRGPCLFVPTSDEEVTARHTAIALKENEYVRISDKATGRVRVEKGEALAFMSPTEELAGTKKMGVNVDASQAALLRDLRTGQLQLVTAPQVPMLAR